MTWICGTFSDVFRAVFASVSIPAEAGVVVDQVGAGGVVLAGTNLALINLLVTSVSRVSSVGAVAAEHVDSIPALSTMQTRTVRAIINVVVAVSTIKAWRAETRVVVDTILAGCSILTRRRLTFVYINLTV